MSALDRLADTAGLEPRYWDIQGHLHERTPETARALLRAMGIGASNDAEIAASLKTLEEAPWREVLPPVVIAWEGEGIAVPLRMPDGVGHLRWTVEYENGAQQTGECKFGDLPAEGGAEIGGKKISLRHLHLPAALSGYHRLRVNEFVAPLIVAPRKCHLPPTDKRYWGITAQLYAVRSARNWGMGDFSDLRVLMDWAAANGANAVGVNPLHALFLDAPQNAGPYAPSSRLFLNPLYLDVAAIPDFAESAEARALMESSAIANGIAKARAAEHVDYPAIAAAKLAVLEKLYDHCIAKHANDAHSNAFRKFVADGGDVLCRFTTFQMLSEHFGNHDWRQWEGARDPAAPDVARLQRENKSRIGFFQYLQWQCTEQLSAARSSGMAIGLYKDLAVSADISSADHWAHQHLFMTGACVGAPPDPFNEKGQEWGVVPLDPHRLRAQAYTHFAALLRANMRHAGALRIDHVMGLQRLFVIPEGAPPSEGAYLRFPLEDLLSIVALESTRNDCMVIGEDLGTVEEGFRPRMAEANVLSYRVLYFENENGRFRPPWEFPALACVTPATHDLATLRGFWGADDISAKARLGIFRVPEEEQQARFVRDGDKRALLAALADEKLLPDGVNADAPPEWTPALAAAIHAYLARTPSLILLVQLDDLADERFQANLPGSTNEYPNWQKRLRRSLEELESDATLKAAMAEITRERAR